MSFWPAHGLPLQSHRSWPIIDQLFRFTLDGYIAARFRSFIRYSSLNKNPAFLIFDLVYPVTFAGQPLKTLALSAAIIAFVVVTSYLRIRLGRRLWSLSFSIYFAAAALFWTVYSPIRLEKWPCKLFDGGKLFVDLVCFLVVAISLLRMRHAAESVSRPQIDSR